MIWDEERQAWKYNGQTSSSDNVSSSSEEVKEPQDCTPEEAAHYLMGKKKVTILTGGGISVASGVPTFR